MGYVNTWSPQQQSCAHKSRRGGCQGKTSACRAARWQVKSGANEHDEQQTMVDIVEASQYAKDDAQISQDDADMSTSDEASASDNEFQPVATTPPAFVKEELSALDPAIGASFASSQGDVLKGDQIVASLAAIYSSVTLLATGAQKCSDACLITSLVYVDRIIKLYPEFEISDLSIHRLLATTLVLSAKMNDDVYYNNAYYSKVCGLNVKELNMLETTLLGLIKWKVQVTTEEYQEYHSRVVLAFNGTKTGAGVD